MKVREKSSQNVESPRDESVVRPLARVTARAISDEELARVAGGLTEGISNFGGSGDRDYLK